jgi:hypothetical protein
MVDTGTKPFETVLLLDTYKKSESLTHDESNRLHQEVLKDYEGEQKLNNEVKLTNMNGLQVKFSMLSLQATNHKVDNGIPFLYRTAVFALNGIGQDYKVVAYRHDPCKNKI